MNNEMRSFFRLKPIEETWLIEKYNDQVRYYDTGGILMKVIGRDDTEDRYYEFDNSNEKIKNFPIIDSSVEEGIKEIKKRNQLITKEASKSMRFVFKDYGVRQELLLDNFSINKEIRIPLDSISSIERLEDDFDQFKESLPDHFEIFLDELSKSKRRRIKYKNGDVFRIDVDINTFVYGLVIGCFSDYRKHALLPKQHPLSVIMAVPVVIRLFDLVSHNPYLNYDELSSYNLQDAHIVMDDHLRSNTYVIVDHKDLEVEDIDFPMHALFYSKSQDSPGSTNFSITDYDHLVHLDKSNENIYLVLSWGFASITVDASKLLKEKPPLSDYHSASNIAVGYGLNLSIVNHKPYLNYNNDFKVHEQRTQLFQYLSVDPNISFDEFNKRYSGYTRQEYLELLKTF